MRTTTVKGGRSQMEKSMTLTYQRHTNSGIYDFKIFFIVSPHG